MKKSDNTEVQKLTALEQLDDLQVRLLRIAPERDRASSDATSLSRSGDDVGGFGGSAEKSVQGKTPTKYEPSSLSVQETPVLAHTPQPQPEVTTGTGRRSSLMYDAASDGENEEHDSEVDIEEESEEASSTPARVQVQVPTLQPAPRVKKQVTPAVTAPVVQSKSTSASSTETVVSAAGVVDASLSEEGIIADGSTFIVSANLRASQPGDLNISEGEILKIVQTRPDGWWMARNSSGMIGLVPKTYLRQALPMDEQRKAEDESKETTPPTRQVRCLGDAQVLDPHLSFACHLTPRLSHSNIGFHDLYWNYRDDKLRKRRVRISKLVRLVRLEGMPKQDGEVSNVHTIRAQVKNRTWTFNTRTDTTSSGVEYGDFIVRSNYNMTDVVLLIEASRVVQTQPSFEERSLGIITIDLINKGEVIFSNKTYCGTLRFENIFDRSTNNSASTQYKIVLKVLDVPQELVPFVEYAASFLSQRTTE
ncbi:unnamed protein product [Angiostrongylus costaricensis]|uniref:SH3 domain-containing protein n=1 Tax=Angiostrongylus costaricensis TaxID=334426 RepID=A0A0R3PYW0_ANGCS|nr:unnamed protein product [Angiostrongylus costaricensis]